MDRVTEEKWSSAKDFSTLHHILWHIAQGRPRKYRLIGCHFCRLFRPQMIDERGHAVLDLVERYADDPELAPELDVAFRAAKDQGVFDWAYYVVHEACLPDWDFENYCSNELDRMMAEAHDQIMEHATTESEGDWETRSEAVGQHTSGVIVPIMREVFGNPFRSVAFDPAWRTTDVLLLAKGIYEERAFDRMPILADALQDAGCGSDDLLGHLRDPNAAHVRGCWALDLVLDKE
jgi:hypothetical protein